MGLLGANLEQQHWAQFKSHNPNNTTQLGTGSWPFLRLHAAAMIPTASMATIAAQVEREQGPFSGQAQA